MRTFLVLWVLSGCASTPRHSHFLREPASSSCSDAFLELAAQKQWAERVPDWVLSQLDEITEMSWEGAGNPMVEGQRIREILAHPEWNEINNRLFGMQMNSEGDVFSAPFVSFAPFSEVMRRLNRERLRQISTGLFSEEDWIHPALAFESRADRTQVQWIRLGVDPVPSASTHQLRVLQKYQLLTHQDWEDLLAQGKLPVDVSVFLSHDSAHIRDLFGDLSKMVALRKDAQDMVSQRREIRLASKILDGSFDASFPLSEAERYYLRSWFVQESLVLPRSETASQVRIALKQKFGIDVDLNLAKALATWEVEGLYGLASWVTDHEAQFLRFSGAIHLDQFNFWTAASGKNGYDNLLVRPESLESLWRTEGVSSLKLENLRGLADAAQANLRWARHHTGSPFYTEFVTRGRSALVAFFRGWQVGLELQMTGATVVSESGLSLKKGSQVLRWIDSYAPNGGLLRAAYSLPDAPP